MNPKEVNLLVYDTNLNFAKSKDFLGTEGVSFKSISCVEKKEDVVYALSKLNEDDYVYLVVHVFYTKAIEGVKRFVVSNILEHYPKIGIMYISDGDEMDIKHQLISAKLPDNNIYKYHEVYSNIEDNKVKVYRKREILSNEIDNTDITTAKRHFKYAIITALYDNEFEELCKFFDFPSNEKIEISQKIFSIGYLNNNRNIQVIAAFQNVTGMVDSAILATLMLENFKPEYLIMTGVCAGNNEFNFGDIIVAKQIYTFQKGKLSDIKIKNQDDKLEPLTLYNVNGEKIEYFYDTNGEKVDLELDFEKFEIEHDSIITLDSKIHDSINLNKSQAIQFINQNLNSLNFSTENFKINIEIEPMACSTMVINKKDFFEKKLKPIHKRTAGIEMESYGIARACSFGNEGKTKPIIIKAVMDNANNKSDSQNGMNNKKLAAYTSALFLNYILENNVI